DAFIDAVLRDRDASGDALLAAKDYLGAHEAYASAIDDLTGLRDVSAISKKLAALEAIQEYKRALKADADAIDKQAKLSADINNVAQGLTATDTRVEALGKIRSQVGDLRVHFSDPADSPERRLARRVLNAVFVEAYESATLQYEPAKNYDMALVELELAGAVSPKSAEVPYQQARISALKGDKKKALQFLRKALENGFHNIDRIKAETAFETLRSDPDFQSILSSKLTTD
ncbi:MAG: hypothetical protein JO314_08225, partial [Acidobacteria bacterium]|nr:hypothetical protein [Acidobacteriota bacterium]